MYNLRTKAVFLEWVRLTTAQGLLSALRKYKVQLGPFIVNVFIPKIDLYIRLYTLVILELNVGRI